jgi:peptidyl-prolyl cis-trans isomerase C
MRKYLVAGSLLLMCTVFFIHGKSFAGNDGVVANIGDEKITLSEFNGIIGSLDAQRQAMIEKNPKLKETFLRQLVQTIVLADLAKEKGVDKLPDVKKQLKLFTDNILANEVLRKEVVEKISIPESELKSYYDSHKDEFKTPEMVRASHILVKVSATASAEEKKKAKEKAEDILKKIKSGQDFAKLASEFSDDPGSKTKGGDLGFFQKGRMVKAFEDAAFSLKPGQVSGIVDTQFGYHIIKVTDRKSAGIESFDTAKEKIKQRLLQEKIKAKVSEYIDKAMKDAKAELHPEVISGLKK